MLTNIYIHRVQKRVEDRSISTLPTPKPPLPPHRMDTNSIVQKTQKKTVNINEVDTNDSRRKSDDKTMYKYVKIANCICTHFLKFSRIHALSKIIDSACMHVIRVIVSNCTCVYGHAIHVFICLYASDMLQFIDTYIRIYTCIYACKYVYIYVYKNVYMYMYM